MKPELTRILLILFSVLGLIEALFIGILCSDILKVDRSARREFQIVKTSQDISNAIRMFHEVTQNAWRGDAEALRERPELRRNLDNFLNRTIQELADLGEPPDTTAGMKASINDLLGQIEVRRVTRGTPNSQPFKIAYLESAKHNTGEFLRAIRRTNQLVKHQAVEQPMFGIAPMQLLYAAAGINVLYLVCVGSCVGLLISRPVSQLAKGCERITKGLPLQKSPVLSSELDSLQESFYRMSLKIIENEQGRKSYVALLQTVQLSVISRVRERLSDFAGSSTLGAKARKGLETATTNLLNLESLLQSMTEVLANSALQQSFTVRLSSCSTGKLLSEVSANVEALLRERKITLNLDGADYQLELDGALIRRVLLNLVSNAIKYSPEGASVSISVVSENNGVRFNVQDRGPGISAEGRKKLFRRYSQLAALDGVKRAGTGLGLVICKEIVEAHNGEIGCDSTPGSGSCFWFRVPATTVQPQVPTNGRSEQLTTGGKEAREQKAKTGSMIMGLASTLLLFLLIQSLVFFQLNSMLNDLTGRAENYSVQKEVLLATQESFARQMLWAEEVELAAEKHDFAAVRASMSFLSKLKRDLSFAYSHVERKKRPPELFAVLNGQTELLQEVKHAMNHLDEVLADMAGVQKRIKTIGGFIENKYYRLFDLQRDGFNALYDWSKQLRSQMLTVLLTAACADLFVIVAALLVGINIARRITVLKAKALDFAAGKHILPSLSGNDELTFLDQRLCEVSDDIRKAETQRQELMAVINHDLRTPLAAVLSVLEVLSLGVYGMLAERELCIVEESDEELQRLLLQINDLLTIEKIDSGAYDLALQDLRVGELLGESVSSVSEDAEAKNVSISISAETAVSELVLRGDKQLLVRLCAIVLKNAIESSACNTSLKLNVNKSGGLIAMDVEDCGKGIDPELLPVIFQRFRFVDGKPIGGLGLALAFRVCQLHEGEIQIKQSSPAGTTVGISLPLAA